jgi:hypothetical protein
MFRYNFFPYFVRFSILFLPCIYFSFILFLSYRCSSFFKIKPLQFVTREQVAHPTLFVPHSFSLPPPHTHTFASKERSAPWPCPAALLPCRQSVPAQLRHRGVLLQPDLATCFDQAVPASRRPGVPTASCSTRFASLPEQHSCRRATIPTRGHHWEGFIQDLVSPARKKPAAGLSEAQAQ